MPRFKQNYFKPDFEFAQDLFEGLTWKEPNPKGTDTYDITLESKGFTCDCPGFTFRGKCKHTLNVNNRIKEAIYGEVPEYYTL